MKSEIFDCWHKFERFYEDDTTSGNSLIAMYLLENAPRNVKTPVKLLEVSFLKYT